MDGWTDGRTDGRMDGWMDGRTDGWIDGWTGGRTDGWRGQTAVFTTLHFLLNLRKGSIRWSVVTGKYLQPIAM